MESAFDGAPEPAVRGADDTVRIDLGDGIVSDDGGTSIRRIDLTVGDGEEERSITVEGRVLSGPPSEGATFRTGGGGDDALSYFELTVTSDGDDGDGGIDSATVTFTVDADELDARGLDTGDVALVALLVASGLARRRVG